MEIIYGYTRNMVIWLYHVYMVAVVYICFTHFSVTLIDIKKLNI